MYFQENNSFTRQTILFWLLTSQIAIPFIEDNSLMRRNDGTYEEDIECIVEPKRGKGGIFISNIEAAENHRTLARLQIGAVITAVKGKNMSDTMPPHIEYLYIPGTDHQSFDLSPFFQAAIELLTSETKRTNVLVHCMAGVSRSATLVMAFLMKSMNISFQQAFKMVKSKRKIISPNTSFIQQLQQFQKTLRQPSKPQMDQSTTTSWYKSPSKPIQESGDYNQKLKAQIHKLFQLRQSSKV